MRRAFILGMLMGLASCIPDVVPRCNGALTLCDAACADLTADPANCGACGHDCQGGACTAGACQPLLLAPDVGGAFAVAVDADSVYWTEQVSPGSVMRVPIDGGSPTPVASGLDAPLELAVDGDNVYFSTSDGKVMKAPRGGGPATALATGQDHPTYVAVDAHHLYWTNEGSEGAKDGSVMKLSLSGGAPSTLATAQDLPGAIVVDAANVYWIQFGDPFQPTGAVMKLPLSGSGAPAALVTGLQNPNGLAADASNLYFTEDKDHSTSGVVKMVPIAGGDATILYPLQDDPARIAVDATNVYWLTFATGTKGTVMRAPSKGGDATSEVTLASAQKEVFALTLSPTAVYWTSSINGPDGAVWKVAK